MAEVTIQEALQGNDQAAEFNRQAFRAAGVLCVNLIGGPGCGKTSLTMATLDELDPEAQVGVIVGDPRTERDATRWARHSHRPIVYVEPPVEGALQAAQIRRAMSQMDLAQLDLVIIENASGLAAPAAIDLGEVVKVAMFSVAAGDDKAEQYPSLIRRAGAVVLNKMDLLPLDPFDLERFRGAVRRINPAARLWELSTVNGAGVGDWVTWLREQLLHQHVPQTPDSGRWFG